MTTSIPDNIQDQTLANAIEKNVRNILINGGMEIWQRGTGFTNPADNTPTADMWRLRKAGSSLPTANVSQSTGTKYQGQQSLQIACSNAGSGLTDGVYVRQGIYFSDRTNLVVGEKYSVSVRVKTSTANKWRISVRQSGSSDANSSYHTGSDTWELLTATFTIGSAAAGAHVRVGMVDAADVAVSTGYIDSVMLVHGDTPIPYVAEDTALEFHRCQRDYEISDLIQGLMSQGANTGTYYQIGTHVIFRTIKSATPTVTSTITYVSEDGTTTDLKAGYTAGQDSLNTGGYRQQVYKAVGGNRPDKLRFTWIAEV